MKMKTVISCLLSSVLMISALTACSVADQQNEQRNQKSQSEQSKQNNSEGSGKTESAGKHTLYIRDADKRAEMTATFYNSMTGKSESVPMQKVSEENDYITYSCEGDINAYNMVHMTYGAEPTMNVAFNEFVSGWYLYNDELLPYVEGQEPNYKPEYTTKVFPFDGYDKNVYIWTPKDYEADAEEKYSTIYMLDGQSVLSTDIDTTFNQGCWNVSEHVASMMSQTDNKAIIVAIETTGKQRNDELIPDIGEIASWAKDSLETKQSGTKLCSFICDELVPYIEKNYNVYMDREHKGLCGSSYGGLEAFYVGFERPECFGTIGSLSPSFYPFEDETLINYLMTKQDKASELPFLYMYMGSNDSDEGAYSGAVYNTLVKNGYPKDKIIADKYDQGHHFLAYWRNIYPEFLEAMFTHKVTGLTLGLPIDESRLSMEETESSTGSAGPGGDYIYYDNSETKWETVYAYWWESNFATTTNKITGEVYGAAWPGMPMEKLGDTDIYRIVIPVGANRIIFNTGISDEEIKNGTKSYQTADLSFDENSNAGQVYKLDLSQEATHGRGIEKTKFTYPAGEWSDYAP